MTTNNHQAHGPVSLDRLHQISEILSKAAAQSDGGNLGYAMADAVKVIDGAIAAFGAEPVAYMTYKGYLFHATDPKLAEYSDPTPLYDAPPAPVVPETLPCAVELKPGFIIGKGCKTETLLVALQRRADYCAEIDAMTPEERAEHDANIKAFKAMLPTPDIEILSSALRNAPLAPSDSQGRPRAPVVPEECKEAPVYVKALTKEGAYIYGFNACRSAMLKAGNSPVTPDGYVLVPKKLTAENGAKSVLSGEFSETKFINCPECFGDDDCETCDGSGRIEITVPVTWTTIKDIWAKGVEHFAAAPQQEVKP